MYKLSPSVVPYTFISLEVRAPLELFWGSVPCKGTLGDKFYFEIVLNFDNILKITAVVKVIIANC